MRNNIFSQLWKYYNRCIDKRVAHSDVLEGESVGDIEYEEKSISIAIVRRCHRSESLLTSSIEDLNILLFFPEFWLGHGSIDLKNAFSDYFFKTLYAPEIITKLRVYGLTINFCINYGFHFNDKNYIFSLFLTKNITEFCKIFLQISKRSKIHASIGNWTGASLSGILQHLL